VRSVLQRVDAGSGEVAIRSGVAELYAYQDVATGPHRLSDRLAHPGRGVLITVCRGDRESELLWVRERQRGKLGPPGASRRRRTRGGARRCVAEQKAAHDSGDQNDRDHHCREDQRGAARPALAGSSGPGRSERRPRRPGATTGRHRRPWDARLSWRDGNPRALGTVVRWWS